jgi:coenzyme PQQ synthesis protein D (PqqD)
MNLPRARRDDLLTTKLDDEVVIYDPESKQAHSLNRVAVAVWNHADGAKTIAELQRMVSGDLGAQIDHTAVVSAIRKLERAHLLLDKVGTLGPMTRREILGKGGKLGAAAMVTPLIASALVPVAAAAASPGACTNPVACVTFCGTGTPGTCGCFPTTEGGAWCGQGIACATAEHCTTSADCPTGSRCTATCCGGTICEPACETLAPNSPLPHGQTSTGYFA